MQRREHFEIRKTLNGTSTHDRVLILASRCCQHLRRNVSAFKCLAAYAGVRVFPFGFEQACKHVLNYICVGTQEARILNPHLSGMALMLAGMPSMQGGSGTLCVPYPTRLCRQVLNKRLQGVAAQRLVDYAKKR